jgi:hypothetical protein
VTAYTPADVAALTSVTCRKQHGLGAPEQPCFGCRASAERLLDVVADGIAHRAKTEALRGAADALHDPACSGCADSPHIAAAAWLRNRADSLERAI